MNLEALLIPDCAAQYLADEIQWAVISAPESAATLSAETGLTNSYGPVTSVGTYRFRATFLSGTTGCQQIEVVANITSCDGTLDPCAYISDNERWLSISAGTTLDRNVDYTCQEAGIDSNYNCLGWSINKMEWVDISQVGEPPYDEAKWRAFYVEEGYYEAYVYLKIFQPNNQERWHAARILCNDKASSKLGNYERVRHIPEQLEGTTWGNLIFTIRHGE